MTPTTLNILFLAGCIPARLLLAWGSTKIPVQYLKYFGAILLAMSIGIAYMYFSSSQMKSADGSAKWWASYRIIIACLWLAAALYAFQEKRNMVWVPLGIEVVLGLLIFVTHRF